MNVARKLGIRIYDIPIFLDEVTLYVPEEVVRAMIGLVNWRTRVWKWMMRSSK